jgi:hypothetical protein
MKINVLLGFFAALAIQSVFAGNLILQDDQLRADFDPDSGALIRFENKNTHWTIERRPELGVSFRLFAPLPAQRWNPVFGRKQHAVEAKQISGNAIEFKWTNLVSENGGTLPMTLTSMITLTNGGLVFSATLENNSPLTVETIDYPYFGDFNPPTRTNSLTVRVMTNNIPANLKIDEIYPHFGNEKGYWGVFWPTKTREAQTSRWCLISAPDEGLYTELAVPAATYRLQWTFEQHPGLISNVNSLVPPEDEIAGTPVHLEFRACHFIFAAPHSTTNLMPVLVRCYQGDWRSGINPAQP